jgi:hypothetical protein
MAAASQDAQAAPGRAAARIGLDRCLASQIMDPVSVVLGAVTGALAGRFVAALLPGHALHALAAWCGGAVAGAVASALASSLTAGARGIPITQQSAGIDLASLLGGAGAGAFGGLAVIVGAQAVASIARRR